MKVPRPNRPKSRAGFTLLEVLVAAAILSIVISIMLGILSAGLSLWRNTQGKIEVDAEGRAGSLLLMQDISNVIMPKGAELWPDTVTAGGRPYFRFLTLKPLDYQDPVESGDVGDVCYVEYFFADDGTLMRRFYGSRWTYDNILQAGAFPRPGTDGAQVLAINLLEETRDSVRGTPLYAEAGETGFVLLAKNNPGQEGEILPHRGPMTAENPPVGVEINFAATDSTAARNPQLLESETYQLRNAGYFSLRYDFPQLPDVD